MLIFQAFLTLFENKFRCRPVTLMNSLKKVITMKKLNTKTHNLSPVAALVATMMLSSGSLHAQTEVNMNLELHSQTEAHASTHNDSQQSNAAVESESQMSANANASVSTESEPEQASQDTRPPAREGRETAQPSSDSQASNGNDTESATNELKLGSSISSLASSGLETSLVSAEQPAAVINASLSQVTELALDSSSRLAMPTAPEQLQALEQPQAPDAPETPALTEQHSGSDEALEGSVEQLVSAQAVVSSTINMTSDIASGQALPQATLPEIGTNLESNSQSATSLASQISQQASSINAASQMQSVTGLASNTNLVSGGGVSGANNQNQLSNVSDATATTQLNDAAGAMGQVEALSQAATMTEMGTDSLVAGAVDSTINSAVDGAINGVVNGTVNSTVETAIEAAVESTLDSTLETALGDIINP